jgi:hypothetical protein
MNIQIIIIVIITIGLLCHCAKKSTNPDSDKNATVGEINVTGDYQTSLNYVLPVKNTQTGNYYGVIAIQSLNFFEDEYGLGLYSDGYAVFTKRTGDFEWMGYTANDLDASFDVSDTCKPELTVNNIVLYYDSTYSGFWVFNGDNLDSSKSVTINGQMSTDARLLGICGN